MEIIHLRQTLPQVFADRDAITSDVWHQDLVLRKGERYLIEAASGTGKSSLCSYIYGYRHDYQGIINFDERNIRSLSIHEWVELRKHSLSMLFQELRIFPELTALENVQLKNRLTNYKKKKEILALFETLGISEKVNEKAGKLSFGQQKQEMPEGSPVSDTYSQTARLRSRKTLLICEFLYISFHCQFLLYRV